MVRYIIWDIGSNAVTNSKISDTDGVRLSDIVNAEIKTEDFGRGAIMPKGA